MNQDLFIKNDFNGILPSHNFGSIDSMVIADGVTYTVASYVDDWRIVMLLFLNDELVHEEYLESSDFRLYGYSPHEYKNGERQKDGHHLPSCHFDYDGYIHVFADMHHQDPDQRTYLRHPIGIRGAEKIYWRSKRPFQLDFRFCGHNFPGHGFSHSNFHRCPVTGNLYAQCRHHTRERFSWYDLDALGWGLYRYDLNLEQWFNVMPNDNVSLFYNHHGYVENGVKTPYQGFYGDVDIDDYGRIHCCTVMSKNDDVEGANTLMYAVSKEGYNFDKYVISEEPFENSVSISVIGDIALLVVTNRETKTPTLYSILNGEVISLKTVPINIPHGLFIGTNKIIEQTFISGSHPHSDKVFISDADKPIYSIKDLSGAITVDRNRYKQCGVLVYWCYDRDKKILRLRKHI